MDTDLNTALSTVRPIVDEVVSAVHSTPELAYDEVQTAALLIERLEHLGARVSRSVAGLPTCFRAELGPEHGPAVGIVVPLDAVPMHVRGTEDKTFNAVLPVHACGHSVIAGAAVGAVQLLKTSPSRLHGRLVVMGIPADEIHGPAVRARGGGKAITARAGVWDDLDALLYAHPEFLDTVWLSSRWMSRRRITLHGPRAFAVDTPDVLAVFSNMLQGYRRLVSRYGAEWIVLEAASFEGDVEDGSPCGAEVDVLIFGHDRDELQQRLDEVAALAREACAGTGVSPNISGDGSTYEGILPNTVLQAAISSVFGESYVPAPGELPFATDFGNLSRRAPSAQVGIGRAGGWRFHTEEGAEEFASQDGHDIAARLAWVLASSVLMLTSDREMLARARDEFEARRSREQTPR
jgi:metal-dependent amidase/aminoacylase/carboxypeptidase family protein